MPHRPPVHFRTGGWAAQAAGATLRTLMSLHPLAPPSGAAMDQPLPPPRGWRARLRRWPWLAVLLALPALWWVQQQRLPGTPRLLPSAQLAVATPGQFRDELPLRAQVEPLRSVQLSAQESGRIDAVNVREGDWVEAGTPLLRLHSPEQEQLLMQRGAEVAQQLANVSLQRSAMSSSLAAARRELTQLQMAEQQAGAEWQRQQALAEAGFVSRAAAEQAQRQLQLARQLQRQAEHDLREDSTIRQRSLAELDRTVQGLQRGLQLLEGARSRLTLRAPIAGRLSGFTPRLGATLRPGETLGRIDDPGGGTQLLAEVDEFYLPRLRPGLEAHSPAGALRLAQVLPQVQGGKVRVQLHWQQAPVQPLQAGQAIELRLQFSPPTPALLLPDGPGVQARLLVRQGELLQARSVRLGRRAAGQVEVLEGLRPGDEVLISLPPHGSDTLLLP